MSARSTITVSRKDGNVRVTISPKYHFSESHDMTAGEAKVLASQLIRCAVQLETRKGE